MPHIVDLHIHSHYSRATSKEMNLSSLYRWGKLKGITVIGTGDFTHPAWFSELQEKLEPAEPGLFRLKDELAAEQDALLPASCRSASMRFVLTVEISTIYKRHDAVRKVHSVLVVPSFKAAAKINHRLGQIGNLTADGRPILGLDTAELLKITLSSDPDALFIPAHIWTPWFSIFGSKSGFASLEEAFGELAGEIVAVETGLSSDPAMNWQVGELQNRTLVSHSDAHSPAKLGREANVIDAQLTYSDIIGAIRTNDQRFVGTIEFYPEEGKYHADGHRNCQVILHSPQTKQLNGICPKCGKPLTVGVAYRIEELATEPAGYKHPTTKQVEYIIPLAEILAELHGVRSSNSSVVQRQYQQILSEFGNEFFILREIPLAALRERGFSDLADGLHNMRTGQVSVQPGYDGVYGVIKVFSDNQSSRSSAQMSLWQEA